MQKAFLFSMALTNMFLAAKLLSEADNEAQSVRTKASAKQSRTQLN